LVTFFLAGAKRRFVAAFLLMTFEAFDALRTGALVDMARFALVELTSPLQRAL
jgi:hypothetical protein